MTDESKAAIANAEEGAMKALDDFMTAFNARDIDAWRKTLNYPHLRISGNGSVSVANTPEEYAAGMDFERFAKSIGWDHSEWDYRKIIHSTPAKVHWDVQFTRYNSDNERIATYKAIYIVTEQDGRWGILFRSSYAP
jgi:hypothetical protein